MPRESTRASTQPASSFHMITRRRANMPTAAVACSSKSDTGAAAQASPSKAKNGTPAAGTAPSTLEANTEYSSLGRPASDLTTLRKRKASEMDSSDAFLDETATSSTSFSTDATNESNQPSSSDTSVVSSQGPEPAQASPDKYNPRLTHDQWKNKRHWPGFNFKKKIYYGADATTRYKPGSQRTSQRDSPATGSPRRPARGGRVGRGRGGGNGNGNGRGRPRGRGRPSKEDSPEPPSKRILTGDDEETVRRLKARQQELKKVFANIGAQQIDILDILATRDISKICRKPKVHKGTPENDELIADLDDAKADAQDIVRSRYDYYVQQENDRFEREKELLGMQCRQRCKEVQEEHLKGLTGDITLLKKAHAHDEDEDRTESGSERDFMPFHHELPESNTRARGYTSVAVQDEKSFREYIESQDDHVRQEVIQEEIRPLLDLIAKAKKKRQDEIDRERTQNMEALVEEAEQRLNMDKIGGHSIPRPLAAHGKHAYGLSALANAADYVSKEHPQQSYIYMPLSPGHHFPRNVLNFDPLPSQRPLAPAPTAVPPPPPAPIQQSPVQQSSIAPTSFQQSPLQRGRVQQIQSTPPAHCRQPSKQYQPPLLIHPYSEARPVPPPFYSQPHTSYSLVQPVAPPRPSLNLQTSMNGAPPSHSRQSSLSTPVTPHVVSTGPGQPIAPAPPKQAPMSMPPSPYHRPSDTPPYRRLSYTPVRAAQSMQPFAPLPSPHAPPPSPYTQPPPPPHQQQQFIFQPPQQPSQHHPAPPPASLGAAWVPRYSVPAAPNSNNPNISSITTVGVGMGHQGVIPVTFVNQTVASRKKAAAQKVKRGSFNVGVAVGDERRGSASGSDRVGGVGSGEGESDGSRPGSVAGGAGDRRGKEGDKGRGNGSGSVGERGGVRKLLPKF